MAEFFWRALLGGLGIALICGPLGSIMIWRRMAYFGDTLSHAALLGVAGALFFEYPIMGPVAIVCVSIGLALKFLLAHVLIPTDALLGLLSHTALAIGLIAITQLPNSTVDLNALLMGDILAMSWQEVNYIWGSVGLLLIGLWRIYPSLLSATIHRDVAIVEGHNPAISETGFIILLALAIALSLKIIGALLISALLIIPAAAARQLAKSPEQMMALASLFGLASVALGLKLSSELDVAAGPAIIVSAASLFFCTLCLQIIRK